MDFSKIINLLSGKTSMIVPWFTELHFLHSREITSTWYRIISEYFLTGSFLPYTGDTSGDGSLSILFPSGTY